MTDANPEALPSDAELVKIGHTLGALPRAKDHLKSRLEFLAELMTDAGNLPVSPILVWRGVDRTVHHALIRKELVVGRRPEAGESLELQDDTSMSKKHFVVRVVAEGCELEDLQSKNGTALNEPKNRIRSKRLCDGDLIIAGNHIFAFLDQRQAS